MRSHKYFINIGMWLTARVLCGFLFSFQLSSSSLHYHSLSFHVHSPAFSDNLNTRALPEPPFSTAKCCILAVLAIGSHSEVLFGNVCYLREPSYNTDHGSDTNFLCDLWLPHWIASCRILSAFSVCVQHICLFLEQIKQKGVRRIATPHQHSLL